MCIARSLLPSSLFLATFLLAGRLLGESLIWPSPHPGFFRGEQWETYITPTSSGNPYSGLFGCVRNNGHRFHEGIDIGPYFPRKRGEATDPIYVAIKGEVVHINRVSGHSRYGKYVVLEHEDLSLPVYTLYSHLAEVAEGLKVGDKVDAGFSLGVMGRTAGGYTIPRDRAHLHFEIGLRLTESFQNWYDSQPYSSKNHHGNYNGMNLVGWDPMAFYLDYKGSRKLDTLEYIQEIDPGFAIRVKTNQMPDFLKRYPQLWTSGVALSELAGWEITISAYGLPLAFKSLSQNQIGLAGSSGKVVVIGVNKKAMSTYHCRDMLSQSGSGYRLGKNGKRLLELLFR